MQMLIFSVWALTAFSVPFLLLVTAFYKYFFQQEKVWGIILRLSLAFIGYGLITAATIPLFIIIIFAGESSEIGATLNMEEMIIYTAITAIYIGISYTLILFVKESFFTRENNENISIFE